MRIAILGTRGIPANYGGFETFAEHLSTRLAARGHEVTVYCRAHYTSPRQLEFQGVRLEVLPTIRHKYFDTVVHAFLSALRAVPKRYDAALICNAANAPFAPILRFTGTPVVINVDGLEHKRKKWNWIARGYYRLAERLATILPNETVTDARVIQDYYQTRYGAESTMIAYGADVERRPDPMVRRWRVEPNRYVLYVSRLEPENNAHLVIEAFKRVRTAHKLLIVGDAPYAHEYIKNLKARARGDKRIVFTGFVFGRDYRALQQNAYCYVHATEVGGTHPALLEAMGFGNCVLTLAAPENIEAVGDAGIPYADETDLAEKLQRVLRDGSLVHAYRNRAQARVQEKYDWEYVVDRYEELFANMAGITLTPRQHLADTEPTVIGSAKAMSRSTSA
ncbi:MAG TPA: glycosyltransferase [Pyrinomonadaceae bacterium]|jgi:glycosyltransferase involved in cell wall biosynthesis|nr:glycosyltransferase [Pyrinomonadaceae bacterium]